MEYIFLCAMGAITYLVAVKCSGKEGQWHTALAEILAYTGINACVLLLIQNIREKEGNLDTLMTQYSVTDTAIALLAAAAVGVFAAILKQLNIEIRIVRIRPGIFGKWSAKTKKIIFRSVFAILLLVTMGFLVRPGISDRVTERNKQRCKNNAAELLKNVESEVENLLSAGSSPAELSNLELGGVRVEKVSKDQHWVSGLGKSGEEAVYMTDGSGCVVYFSYRDRNYAATWSGPSQDEEFLAANNGWNYGKGNGWSGSAFS